MNIVLRLTRHLGGAPARCNVQFITADNRRRKGLNTRGLLGQVDSARGGGALLIVGLSGLVINSGLCFGDNMGAPRTMEGLAHSETLTVTHDRKVTTAAGPNLGGGCPGNAKYYGSTRVFSGTNVTMLSIRTAG